jgi:hypothetical protein
VKRSLVFLLMVTFFALGRSCAKVLTCSRLQARTVTTPDSLRHQQYRFDGVCSAIGTLEVELAMATAG